MNEIECKSWRADNPLHVLASLGALLLADDATKGAARLSWRREPSCWMAVIHLPTDTAEWIADVTKRLTTAGAFEASDDAVAAAARGVRSAKEAHGKAVNTVKDRAKAAKATARKQGLKKEAAKAHIAGALADVIGEERKTSAAFQAAQKELAQTLGCGPAHLGDVAGVAPEVFQTQADAALKAWPAHGGAARHLAALASDACVKDEKVATTPFSFGNGGSGKFMLKDFRKLTTLVTVERLHACMAGAPDLVETTGLGWDPAGRRSHALRWADPGSGDDKELIDVVTHAMAYLGLGILTAIPRRRGLSAIGFIDDCWTWPVWSAPLPLTVIQGVLNSRELRADRPDRQKLNAMGVAEIYRAQRVTSNKRFYFATARAV